jgi:hypothetical protein
LSRTVDLQRLTLVGLGAGGGALAFTLASLPTVQGVINLIEPDEITETNLNRTVFADSHDVSRKKATVTAELLRGSPNLVATPYPFSFRETTKLLTVADFRHVVATVHSREARREIQYETPMVLWDAGATEHGDFFIWRMILGQTECMWCKHPPSDKDPEREKAVQLEAHLGLDVITWLRKIRENEPFTAEEVEALSVCLTGGTTLLDLPTVGQRYGDWETSQCGKLQLPDRDEEIPVPFAPVMAGVLLAGEVIKEFHFPHAVLDSYYWNTLFGRFIRHAQPWHRNPRVTCSFCHDEVYLSQFRRRWGPRNR